MNDIVLNILQEEGLAQTNSLLEAEDPRAEVQLSHIHKFVCARLLT